MKISKLLIVFVLLLSLFLLSCGSSESEMEVVPSEEIEEIEEETLPEPEEEVAVEEAETDLLEVEVIDVSCSVSADCAWNEKCIEGVCGMTSDIYDTEGVCEQQCNFDNVHVFTSDGDELTLSRGQGSYTGAGAIEWKLLSSADYCKGEDATPVAIELIMKNMGQILSREVIVLEVGQESDSITHPSIASIDFTLEVESIDETCG